MPESLTVLGIESSCDETAVAILRSAGEEKAPEILSSVISSQIAIHRQHGGVVPELASRNHSADLPGIIRTACREAGTVPADIDVFGATGGPGLVAALLVGNSTAKALALAPSIIWKAICFPPSSNAPAVPFPIWAWSFPEVTPFLWMCAA